MERWLTSGNKRSLHGVFHEFFLALLGERYALVLAACAELVAAVLLLSLRSRKRVRHSKTFFSDTERILLWELSQQKDEVCTLMRRSDLMPVIAVGDLEGLLGVDLQRLQEDLKSPLTQMASQEEAAAFWRRYHSWDGQETLKTQLERKDGQWLHFSVHRSQDGSVDVVTVRSITEEHQREEEYQMRLQQAEAASQFKTSFLFRMSHEIRTPMNGITGMLTLIRSKLAPDHPAMQYVDRAGELSDHLLSLINDILDMSHIEAGKVELEANPFGLHAFGNKLYDMFGKTLDSKGIRFDVTFDSVTEDWVVGDELRIGQVVINFLSNALKFTSRGEVTVTFRQMMLRENAVDLMIRIHDTGISMAPEFISRIFRPFEQEDASTTRRFGGTGLGMAISDQLVKLMGGQIVVESTRGVGSDFSEFLSLPITEKEQLERLPEAQQQEQ